jgi:hypothetical protein
MPHRNLESDSHGPQGVGELGGDWLTDDERSHPGAAAGDSGDSQATALARWRGGEDRGNLEGSRCTVEAVGGGKDKVKTTQIKESFDRE